jgi:t-SNARE complex subunit (syntaxin)
MTKSEESLGRLEAASERIEKSLYGNGQAGLTDRVTRIEMSVLKTTEQSATNVEAVSKLSISINELTVAVKAHIADEAVHSLWGLITRKKVIVWVLIVFVILNSIVSLFPDLTVVFRWLMKLAGIPI